MRACVLAILMLVHGAAYACVNSAGVLDFELAVPATREVAGRVISEAGGLPQRLTLSTGGARIPVAVKPDGTFRAVVPDGARLAVAPESLPEGYTVRSIRYGDLDLDADPIRFAAAPGTELRITLQSTRGLASVSGRVSGLSRFPADTRVWLIYPDRQRRTRETQIERDGAFLFDRVDAGECLVALAAPGIPATAVAAHISVTAGRDVANIELAAPREVSGRVTVGGGGAPPPFGLRWTGSGAVAVTLPINPRPDGSLTILLPMGEAKIGPTTGLPDGLAVRSLHYGATDLLSGPVRVSVEDRSELSIQLK